MKAGVTAVIIGDQRACLRSGQRGWAGCAMAGALRRG